MRGQQNTEDDENRVFESGRRHAWNSFLWAVAVVGPARPLYPLRRKKAILSGVQPPFAAIIKNGFELR